MLSMKNNMMQQGNTGTSHNAVSVHTLTCSRTAGRVTLGFQSLKEATGLSNEHAAGLRVQANKFFNVFQNLLKNSKSEVTAGQALTQTTIIVGSKTEQVVNNQ